MANKNPSPKTRFPKGKSGNPGGKTAEQVAIERRNAETAMRLREKALLALEALLDGKESEQVAGIMLDAQVMRLLKDAEDRGLGAPVQPHTSPDGSMSPPQTIIVQGVDTAADV
jgi:hypothetical protein